MIKSDLNYLSNNSINYPQIKTEFICLVTRSISQWSCIYPSNKFVSRFIYLFIIMYCCCYFGHKTLLHHRSCHTCTIWGSSCNRKLEVDFFSLVFVLNQTMFEKSVGVMLENDYKLSILRLKLFWNQIYKCLLFVPHVPNIIHFYLLATDLLCSPFFLISFRWCRLRLLAATHYHNINWNKTKIERRERHEWIILIRVVEAHITVYSSNGSVITSKCKNTIKIFIKEKKRKWKPRFCI